MTAIQSNLISTPLTINKVNPEKIETKDLKSPEITNKVTSEIQDIEEKISAKIFLISSWQYNISSMQNELNSGRISTSQARILNNIINDLTQKVKAAQDELKELNSKLEEKKHSASQDQTTQNQADKSQKLAYQTINIKPAIPKQTN